MHPSNINVALCFNPSIQLGYYLSLNQCTQTILSHDNYNYCYMLYLIKKKHDNLLLLSKFSLLTLICYINIISSFYPILSLNHVYPITNWAVEKK